MAGADRVVTSFHLPKKTNMSSPSQQYAGQVDSTLENEKSDDSDGREELELKTYDLDEESMDVDPAETSSTYGDVEGREFIPKTMQQMAEDAAKRQKEQEDKRRRHGAAGRSEPAVALQEMSESMIGRMTRSRSGAIKNNTISSPEASKAPQGSKSSITRRKDTRKRRRRNSESEDDAE